MKQLPDPYSDCMEGIENSDSILVKSVLRKFPVYRQSDCYDVIHFYD